RRREVLALQLRPHGLRPDPHLGRLSRRGAPSAARPDEPPLYRAPGGCIHRRTGPTSPAAIGSGGSPCCRRRTRPTHRGGAPIGRCPPTRSLAHWEPRRRGSPLLKPPPGLGVSVPTRSAPRTTPRP